MRYRGGGGQRVRAHVLDSESGGAKGHYPNRSTRDGACGSQFREIFFSPDSKGNRRAAASVEPANGRNVPKPPKTRPSCDIDGVGEDAVRSTDAATASGQDAKDLARAREQASGKSDFSLETGRDDRSR